MLRDDRIAWAAGLFEGEGCITISSRQAYGCYPHLSLCSTDEDVVRRYMDVVGRGSIVGPYTYAARPEHYKPRWTWTCNAWADIEAVVRMLWPWLGQRRRARIAEVVEESEAAGLGARRDPWVLKPWAMAGVGEALNA